MSRKDLFHRRDHTGGVLFATRGCAHRCDFCTLAVMYQSRVRKRPVAAVAEEYGSFPGKVIILWDDNIASDVEYAKTLFQGPHSSSQMVEQPGEHSCRPGRRVPGVGREKRLQATVRRAGIDLAGQRE